MLLLDQLAEEKINEAITRGEFSNLPGQGLPLQLEDYSIVPEELRMAFKILKNSGFVPPDLPLRNEITKLELDLHRCSDKEERKKAINRLQCLYISLDASGMRHTSLAIQEEYYEKILSRLP